MNWRIGCSGFHYKEWKGIFYPDELPQREWFWFYSSFFNTLELNVTFYRFPRVPYLLNWYNESPGDFMFSVKVPRLITHYKKLNDTARMLGDFYGSIREGLKEKLGPVLFQLPPNFEYAPDRLQLILDAVDSTFKNVIEFRHQSWWIPEVYNELEKKGISFCGISYPGLPTDVVINDPLVYYRFHGVPKLYYSPHCETEIEDFASAVAKNDLVEDVFVYFNNTATAAAIENAMCLYSIADEER